MKHYRWFLAFVFSLHFISLYAQDSTKARRFFIGPFFSPEISGAIAPYPIETRVSSTFGVDMLYSLNNSINFTMGVQFSSKDGSDNGGGYEFRLHSNYIDIPLKCDVYLLKKKQLRPYVAFGLSPNVFLQATETDLSGTASDQSTKNGFYPVNVQGLLGLGLDYRFKKSRFRLELIGRYSITDANQAVPYNTFFNLADGLFTTYARKYYSIGLGLSYLFGI
ncbi:MAG: outer membrane beta-barrel protein [Bacteroidia bacterium]